MNFIWFSVLLISLGGILQFLRFEKRVLKKKYLVTVYCIAIFVLLFST